MSDREQPPAVEPLGAVTSHGLPYPAATDPVSQGAAAIQALAEAVDPRVGTNRTIRGSVSAAGAVVGGSGFTASRSGVGRYTVTFTPAYPAGTVPVAVASPNASTGNEVLTINQPQAGFFQVNVNVSKDSLSNAPVDAGFNFIVIGEVV